MKIIHCADLHLDSRMESHMSERKASARNAEITNTFVRLTQYAKDNGVSVVLIAGDLFDTDRATKKTIDIVLSAIAKTPTVEYLYLRGNHDDETVGFGGYELPENLQFFDDTWTTFRYGDTQRVTISGIEITQQNCDTLYGELTLTQTDVNLVVLHGQIGSSSGTDLINLSLLQNRNIDYLALGHIHAQSLQTLDRRGQYCYSGCLEGRGFDECGSKGFMLLQIDDGRVRPEFVAFAKRTLHLVPVEVRGCKSNSDLLARMKQNAEGISEESMVKFVLTGKYDMSAQFDCKYLEKMVSDSYYFVKVKNESTLQINPEDYVNDISLKGEFIRMILASEVSEEEKSEMIRIGLASLAGEEVDL